MSTLKIGFAHLFWQAVFVDGESNIFFGMCTFVPFALRSLVSANSPGKFYLASPLRSTIPVTDNGRILSGILNNYSKTKIKSSGGRKCSSQK